MEFFIDELRQAIYKIMDNMTENLFNIKDKLKPEEFNSTNRQTVDLTHTTQDFLLEIQNKLFKFTSRRRYSKSGSIKNEYASDCWENEPKNKKPNR
jgi:hypothetical protein